MDKILIFKVGIEGLEEKNWIIIEIPARRTVADLAYTILATFDSLAYNLYNIKHKGIVYDSWVCIEDDYSDVPPENAVITPLRFMNLKKNDKLEMEYDYGSTTTFKITYLGERKLENIFEGVKYPIITDGQGHGMLDDVCDFELKEIVEDTDKNGYSKYCFSPGYEKTTKYDYRKYNINIDKELIKMFGSIDNFRNLYNDDYERFEFKKDLMLEVIHHTDNLIMSVSPIFSNDIVEDILKENVSSIEITDTSEAIFDRLILDGEDAVQYKNKYKEHYMSEIKYDQLAITKEFKNIPKVFINGKGIEDSVEYVFKYLKDKKII